jgi:hypothetical protein
MLEKLPKRRQPKAKAALKAIMRLGQQAVDEVDEPKRIESRPPSCRS